MVPQCPLKRYANLACAYVNIALASKPGVAPKDPRESVHFDLAYVVVNTTPRLQPGESS